MSLTPESQLYTETQGVAPFNWFKVLTHNMETNAECDRALAVKSGAWVTCACGNTCAIIPRNENGKPTDRWLSDLGIKFCSQVGHGKWQFAIWTLHAIEHRSAEILEELRTAASVK